MSIFRKKVSYKEGDLFRAAFDTDSMDFERAKFLERYILQARILRSANPGFTLPIIPILSGEAYNGKGDFLRLLCGNPEFFGSFRINDLRKTGGPDRFLNLVSRCTLVELYKDKALTRDFMTRLRLYATWGTSTYRPPYSDQLIEEPRRFTVVITTEAEEPFKPEFEDSRFFIHLKLSGIFSPSKEFGDLVQQAYSYYSKTFPKKNVFESFRDESVKFRTV